MISDMININYVINGCIEKTTNFNSNLTLHTHQFYRKKPCKNIAIIWVCYNATVSYSSIDINSSAHPLLCAIS
jgi:hypothetical protein